MARSFENDTDDEFSINPNDFVSTQIVIELINNTTHHTKPLPDSAIKLIQLLPAGMVLEVPLNVCAHGHNLTLSIRAKLPDNTVLKFKATAKVDSHRNIDSLSAEISIFLIQYDQEEWGAFTKSFGNRQAQIEDFFTAVKGY